MTLGQHRASALMTAIFGGPFSDPSPLLPGNRIEAVLALFAARQDVSGVKLTCSTAAVGFAAFAPQQVEGPLDHWLGALESAKRVGQGGVRAPKLLTQAGQVFAQSESLIY